MPRTSRGGLRPALALVLALYEGMILVLLIGALIPDGTNLEVFAKNPLSLMTIDQTSVALALLLFVPFVLPRVRSVELFGTKVELIEKIERDVEDARHRLSELRTRTAVSQHEHERALYALASSSARQMETRPRRKQPERLESLEELPLEIGFKNFPESQLLAEIMYVLLEDLPVNRPTEQATPIGTFFNLRAGKIDLYVEYSGVGFMLAGLEPAHDESKDPQEALGGIYERWRLSWLSSIGFHNRVEWVMLKETANKFDIKTMADVTESSDKLIFGANREYFLREDTFPRIKRLAVRSGLPLRFRDQVVVDIADRYSGLFVGDFQVGVGWSTDPLIDDKRLLKIHFDDHFPGLPQEAIPLCRTDVSAHLEGPLSTLRISQEDMVNLNKRAARQGNSRDAMRGIALDFCRGLKTSASRS